MVLQSGRVGGTLHLIYDLFQLCLIQNFVSIRWGDLERVPSVQLEQNRTR